MSDANDDNLIDWYQDMYQESEQKVRVLQKRIEVAARHAERAENARSIAEFWKHWKLVRTTLEDK
jgi:homospermidine synthase